MKCPSCGAADLRHEMHDLPFDYKGQSTLIRNVIGDYCPACGEVVLKRPEIDRVGQVMQAFKRQVDSPAAASH